MSDPITPASPAAPTEPVAAAPTPVEPPKPADPAPTADPWADPVAAKAEIEKLRRENGAARTTAKQTAADEARAELAQTIGKALGVVKDDAPVDPADLTQQITTSQAEAKQARVELAVFRNAAEAGGDPAALLDSASFLEKVANLDPADPAAIAAAIAAAVEANPRLGAAGTATRPPGHNPAQGAGSGVTQAGQLTEADLERLTPAEVVKARKEGRLNTLMGV